MAGTPSRDDLIEQYKGYTEAVVRKLMRSMSLPSAHHDEFVAAGYLGLVEAAERFDFSSGVEFKHFAFLRIRGAVIDSIRECSELSGKAYKMAKALQSAQALREEEAVTGKDRGADANLAGILDHLAKGALAFRLDFAESEDAVSAEAGTGDSPEREAVMTQERDLLKQIVSELPEQERLVIQLYYFEGLSFVEVATRVRGISKSWVSRLHARALTMLKERYLECCNEV